MKKEREREEEMRRQLEEREELISMMNEVREKEAKANRISANVSPGLTGTAMNGARNTRFGKTGQDSLSGDKNLKNGSKPGTGSRFGKTGQDSLSGDKNLKNGSKPGTGSRFGKSGGSNKDDGVREVGIGNDDDVNEVGGIRQPSSRGDSDKLKLKGDTNQIPED